MKNIRRGLFSNFLSTLFFAVVLGWTLILVCLAMIHVFNNVAFGVLLVSRFLWF